MKIYKRFPVRGVVITPANVRELAQAVFNEYKRDLDQRTETDRYYHALAFTLRDKDGTQYEDDDLSIFEEGGFLYTRKIVSIDMRYSTDKDDKLISLGLYHSQYENDANEITIRGLNENWVNGILTRLSEIIANCQPQNRVVRKYRFLISTITNTTLYVFLIVLVLFLSNRIQKIKEMLAVRAVSLVGLIVIAGISLAVSLLYDHEIQALYPNVELQLGPKHLQRETQKRNKLRRLVSLVIVPFFIDLLFLIF